MFPFKEIYEEINHRECIILRENWPAQLPLTSVNLGACVSLSFLLGVWRLNEAGDRRKVPVCRQRLHLSTIDYFVCVCSYYYFSLHN